MKIFKALIALCVSGVIPLVSSALAQQVATPKLPTKIAPYLYRIFSDRYLPRALVVPHGQAPEYSLDQLAEWGCSENMNPHGFPNCARNFISQKTLPLKRQPVLKEKAADKYGHSRYEIETTDGKLWDVWATEFGCGYSPDGSKLQFGTIEDRVRDLRSPWGPEPYNNIAYNNQLRPGEMPYLRRVDADGAVLWTYVYLVQTTGHTEDKWENPEVENPILGFGEVVCPKGSGSTGFLTSTVIRQGTFTFGAMAIEIDTVTGQPKAHHPRIRVVPAADMEKHFRRALAELIEEGVITENDTQITTEPFRGIPPISRYLNKTIEFSERLQRNLLTAYFTNTNTTQGKTK